MTGSPPSTPPSSLRHSLHGFPGDTPASVDGGPRPDLLRRLGRRNRQRSALVIALAVVLVFASSAIAITLLSQKGDAASASGQVTFFAGQDDPAGQTNSLRITVQHLAAPAANGVYQAWILNDQSEQVLALGRLTEKGQVWSLTFSSASSNLLEVGDTLEVTQEQGVASAPAGQVILSGTFPRKAFQHVQHLLVSFPPTPDKIALLVGVLQQTHLLDSQATLLQSIAPGRDATTIACLTQGMLDIIEGEHGADYQPLAGSCARQSGVAAGDGYGLLGKGFVAGAEQHAALALRQPDATILMHQHAALMDIALTNVSGWLATIEQDLLRLRAHPTDLSPLGKISALADAAYHGVDANGDGQVDAVAGEAGAMAAYVQGQLMATLTLTPGT
jgi:hypothetical protein